MGSQNQTAERRGRKSSQKTQKMPLKVFFCVLCVSFASSAFGCLV